MLATQAIPVDTTRHDFCPNVDHFYHRPGLDCRLWPDIPPLTLDSRCPESLYSEFDLTNQMCFYANMAPEISPNQAPIVKSQSFQHGQQWTAREMCLPQAQPGAHLSPFQTHLPRTFEGNGQQMSGMDKPNQAINPGHTSPETVMHAHPPQFRSSPVGHLRHQSFKDFEEDVLRNSLDTVNENIFTEWCWGLGERTVNRPVHEGSVQWSTDSSFGPPRGSSTSVSSEPVNSKQFTHLRASERRNPGPRDTTTLPRGYPNALSKIKTGLSAPPREHPTTWPVLKTQTGPIHRDILSTYRTLSWEYLGSGLHEQTSVATVGLRRKRLTEVQKRRSHILHEQKRRAMIKEGFDDLLNLVPDLKDRSLSKSATLVKAADWLANLISGNKALRAQAMHGLGER